MRFFFLILNLLFYSLSFAQKFPILGFIGVPGDKATVANYSKMKKAGFTISLMNFKNTSEAIQALSSAKIAGMKLILFFPELHSEPSVSIPKIKNGSALLGYVIGDEPKPSQFKDFILYQNIIKKFDGTHLFYTNLYPIYAPTEYLEGLSYSEYVKNAVSQLDLPIVSFDHYPMVNNQLRDDFYQNLEIIRNESAKVNKPFWGFACSTIHFNYKKTNLAELKLQQFGNLLYGAKGIQYFTYWTMTSDPNWKKDNYSYAIVDDQGVETPTFNIVRKVNNQVQRLAWVFIESTVDSVFHIGEIPLGTQKLKQIPKFFSEFSTDGNALVSYLSNKTKDFIIIQNRSLKDDLVLKFNNPKKIYSVNNNSGKSYVNKIGKSQISIQPGDIHIFYSIRK